MWCLNREGMLATKWARLWAAGLVVLVVGALIYWWVKRPPSSETVARWVAEAVALRDAERLWNLMCEAEQQQVDQDTLKRVLQQLHTNYPYLADLAKPSALRNRGAILERKLRKSNLKMAVPVHEVIICYRREGSRLEPLSETEFRTVVAQKPLPKTLYGYRVFVNRHNAYEKVCPLVMRSLVHNTITAALVEGRSVDLVLEEIFLRNNVRTAFYEPHTGRVQAIRVLKQRAPDGTIEYYW